MILGIIPARAGSKRLPRKNLMRLGDKTLVARAVEAALSARLLDRVIVSSDDKEVLALAAQYDPLMPLARPAELAGDDAPAQAYVQHAVATLEGGGPPRFKAVVIVQPTSPFTLGQDIDATVALLQESGADSAVSVMQVEHALHPLKFKELRGNRLLPLVADEAGRMAARQLPPVYVRNGAVYAMRRATCFGATLLGDDSRGYVMPRERSLDINDSFDWALAEFLLTRQNLETR